jgi:hypothetical protein
LRFAAAAAADSMDPEVYAAAAAAASHMGSLALAGLGHSLGGTLGVADVRATNDRSGSPVLEQDPNYCAEGGLGDANAPDLITHADDGFALPRLAGERYSALLSGVQMEAFQRARLGDGGLQRTWVRGQVKRRALSWPRTLNPASRKSSIPMCVSYYSPCPLFFARCLSPTTGSTFAPRRAGRFAAAVVGRTGRCLCTASPRSTRPRRRTA